MCILSMLHDTFFRYRKVVKNRKVHTAMIYFSKSFTCSNQNLYLSITLSSKLRIVAHALRCGSFLNDVQPHTCSYHWQVHSSTCAELRCVTLSASRVQILRKGLVAHPAPAFLVPCLHQDFFVLPAGVCLFFAQIVIEVLEAAVSCAPTAVD